MFGVSACFQAAWVDIIFLLFYFYEVWDQMFWIELVEKVRNKMYTMLCYSVGGPCATPSFSSHVGFNRECVIVSSSMVYHSYRYGGLRSYRLQVISNQVGVEIEVEEEEEEEEGGYALSSKIIYLAGVRDSRA
jgi:hypothetical protein